MAQQERTAPAPAQGSRRHAPSVLRRPDPILTPLVSHTLTLESLHAQFRAQAAQLGLDVDVISDGPLNSEVAIVGEGLGENEIRYGRTFSGGSGRLLFDSIRPFGLHRANVYVTNVCKRQISLGRSGDERHAVHRDELLHWQGLLQWELAQLPNLRIIFCLGGYALEAITGYEGITKWRGSVVEVKIGMGPGARIVRVVCSYNPAYAMREKKLEPVFLMDSHKLRMVLENTWKPHDVEKLINPTVKQARDYIRFLKGAGKPISFDIEVINGETACFGLGNSAHSAMCINLRDGITNRYSTSEEVDILLDLQDLCDSQGVRIIGQNGSFDAYWTRLYDLLCVEIWFDTLLAHHTLYPQLPHGLGFLVAQYTTHPYYKDDRTKWREGGDIDDFWRYNATDVALTYACHERLHRELKEQGLDKFFFDHVMRAQPHLVSATVHGVRCDVDLKESIVEACGIEVNALKAEFFRLVHECTGEPDYYPNPNSTPQMRELFFDKLELIGRGKSTDEANRELMIKNPHTPPISKEMLTALTRYKKEDKFLGTYAESRIGNDGRFRCEYKQYGVQKAPGRLSSAALLDGQGGNLQNQPERAREMYIADEGMVFVYFDLKQAEAQVVAVRARIEKWMAQYEQMRKDGKYDAHCALAADMYKLPLSEVPKKDFIDGKHTIRYVAKRCRHGLNYRMQIYTLSEVTKLPFYQARSAFSLYHSATPELQIWWRQEEAQFRKTKTIYNALGRRWKVIQRLDDDVLASIIAFYPQSTIGDKVTQVWYRAEEDDAWPMDARIAIDVHDNLVGIASPKTAKTALRVLKKHAESPLMLQDAWGGQIIPWSIPAELKMSVPDDRGLHRWSNMKEITL